MESGKIDILYHIKEGSQSYVEQIIIQGNNRTKDKVIRRELLVAPGQIYDSVKVDVQQEAPGESAILRFSANGGSGVDITRRRTPMFPIARTWSSRSRKNARVRLPLAPVSARWTALLGFVEITQGNFDIFNFPYFTGGGEKFRVRLQYGLERQDAEIEFKEPWFLEQRLSLGYNLFYHNATYLSNYYDERNFGASVSLARAFRSILEPDRSPIPSRISTFIISPSNASPEAAPGSRVTGPIVPSPSAWHMTIVTACS